MAYNQPLPGQPAKGGTLRRIGIYIFGVGLGLVLLGLFQIAKRGAIQPQQSQPQPQQAPATNPALPDGESVP